MTSGRSEELFGDGWREPGDDLERTAFYTMVALVAVLGLGSLGWGIWALSGGAPRTERLEGLTAALFGAVAAGSGGAFFAKESRHWDLRHLTAERFVAGGFLFGFGLLLLGAEIVTRTGSAGSHIRVRTAGDVEASLTLGGWLAGAGALDLTIFLILGLAFAYAPVVRIRHRIAGARIERRYALDDKLGEIDDHPCPRDDGFTPVVTLRLRDGRTRTMVCAESAYERMRAGAVGTVVVRGKRLERFHAG